jgi:hypothetical protein
VRALLWFGLIMLPALSVAAEGTIKVDGVKDGRPLALTAERQEKIAGLALAMLASSSYEAAQPLSPEQSWRRTRQQAHLHVTFTPTRPVSFKFSTTGPAVMGEVQVAELLMRLGGEQWPDYILVRDEDRVRAFAKYGSREAQALRAALGAGATAR